MALSLALSSLTYQPISSTKVTLIHLWLKYDHAGGPFWKGIWHFSRAYPASATKRGDKRPPRAAPTLPSAWGSLFRNRREEDLHAVIDVCA